MSEDTAPDGPVITPAEDAELRELFAALSDTSAAAAEALSNADVERFYDLDTYVAAIIKRIRAILLGPTQTAFHVVRSNRPEPAVLRSPTRSHAAALDSARMR
jgi:hypothetical protein